jgi:hypothetical protein
MAGPESVGHVAAAPASLSSNSVRRPRPQVPSDGDIARHRAFVTTLTDPLWASGDDWDVAS